MLSVLAFNKRMADKRKLTPYEIGLKIKSLLEFKVGTKQILETVDIKRAQLTTYKKIINNGRLEDLRTKSVRKVLAEEKKSDKFKGSAAADEIIIIIIFKIDRAQNTYGYDLMRLRRGLSGTKSPNRKVCYWTFLRARQDEVLSFAKRGRLKV